jgi:hypothetical protein
LHPGTVRAPIAAAQSYRGRAGSPRASFKFSSRPFRPWASTTSSSSRLISAIWVLESFIPRVPSLNYLRESAPLSGNLRYVNREYRRIAPSAAARGNPPRGDASLAVSAYTNFELLLAHGPVGDQLPTAQLKPAARVTPHSHRCVLVVRHPAVRRHLRFLRVSYGTFAEVS